MSGQAELKISPAPSRRAKAKPEPRAHRPFVIDFHAHVIVPEVAAFSRPYTVTAASDPSGGKPRETRRAQEQRKKWTVSVGRKMSDFKLRIRDMDKAGANRSVLGSDYPVGEADPVGFVRKARGVSAADKETILSKNVAKLPGLSV